MARNRHRVGIAVGAFCVLAIILLVVLWDWNWFRPLVAARASAALGHPVTIGKLHVDLGRVTQVELDDSLIHNQPGFDSDAPLAVVPKLIVCIQLWNYIFHHRLELPLIDIEHPVIDARELKDGHNNWTLPANKNGSSSGPSPQIGTFRINDGKARVRVPNHDTDFNVVISTRKEGEASSDSETAGADDKLYASAKGSYAGQPVTAKFVGGALLSLRNNATPYPVDLSIHNGSTDIALDGTIKDPLKFAGADLKLKIAGKNLADLYPLTGVPIPPTPPYHVAGQLDYADGRVRFRDFAGVIGSSDLSGSVSVEPRPHGPRPLVTADMQSRSVDLNDLAGFIGGTPGDKSTSNQSAEQKKQLSHAQASDRLLPETKMNFPKLLAADVVLHYKGHHIQGRYMPFDDIVVALDIKDGDIKLHPLNFAIGKGTLASTISLNEKDKLLYTRADIKFDQLDLARIMKATHAFEGAGRIGGGAVLNTYGNSLSAMLSNGNGSLNFNMAAGGNLSALLQDISGLQFGDALLSALGIPSKASVRCLRSQFTLTKGVLQTNIFALDTSEAVTRGAGTVDFHTEKLDYKIQTKPVNFSIGSLHAPIDITGTLKHPSILPDIPTVAAKGGIAAGLGVLFPPLALLATVQLGVGNNTDCQRLSKGS